MLSEGRPRLDGVAGLTSLARDMSAPLNESERTERRAFVESFVKEIVVSPDQA